MRGPNPGPLPPSELRTRPVRLGEFHLSRVFCPVWFFSVYSPVCCCSSSSYSSSSSYYYYYYDDEDTRLESRVRIRIVAFFPVVIFFVVWFPLSRWASWASWVVVDCWTRCYYRRRYEW